jgi:hypothetical protein
MKHYGVTRGGNFEGRNILYVHDKDDLTVYDDEEFQEFLGRTRPKLLARRNNRVHPNLDDKVLTSWNGLMLKAFAEAAVVLSQDDFAQVALKNAAFLCDTMRPEGRLLRTYKDGRARLNGYLEDYAYLIDALLTVHEIDFDGRWIHEASELTRQMVELFWDDDSERFYDTGHDHEALILRPRDIMDNATPAGSSAAADVLQRMAAVVGEPDYARKATTSLRSVRDMIAKVPTAAGHWLGVLDYYLSKSMEIAIVGDPSHPHTFSMRDEVHRRFIPNRVLLGKTSDSGIVAGLPLFEGRDAVGGQPTAYVCQNYICQLPVTHPSELAAQLGG